MTSSPSRLSNVFYLFLGALSVGLVVAALAIAGVIGADKPASAQAPAPASPAAPRSAPASVAGIYERVSPGVVFIAAQGAGQAASGSGFVIDAKGSIVTNDHVVEGADRVSVRFGEQSDDEPADAVSARVVGTDPSTDLALLRIDPAKVPDGLQPLELASSENLEPGEPAIAIGSPFGLQGTVTSGIVSALDREIESPNGFTIAGVIQTDAAINPGNSGGPLLNGDGRVIGVNSQIATGGQSNANSGVGFAVPIDTVKDVVPQLARDGKIDRAFLGVSSSLAAPRDGALVRTVSPGGPADRGDLRTGDLIVELDGKAVRTPSGLGRLVLTHTPGDTVGVVVQRGNDRQTLRVTLGSRPDQPTTP